MLPSFNVIMASFQALLNPLHSAITRFFPATTVNSVLTAYVAPRIMASVGLRVRLIWTTLYPNTKFDPSSNIHVGQLVDIYYAMGYDWHTDKFLREHYVPPAR